MRRADIEVTFDLVVGGGNSPKLGLLEVTVDRVLYVFGVPRMQQFYLISSLNIFILEKKALSTTCIMTLTLDIHVQCCSSYHD